ncbi:hypothetical protein HAT86_12055 [Roseovarius gahaiensis]|uniref:Uncharacterized protein n=1 Tax=Roseovarius gahaiensis TaxID=2716691 RepID=A0A967BDP4_9RHOB|nr:hypothetical protein [Roseovarius gahaiensis]NHQ75189.1 hypothetical protein [Roseovarius gahaiensis]
MTTETRDQIRDHLFQKLAETAESIRKGGAMNDEQVTTAFLGVGITLAQHTCGPIGAAEWLRDMADEIERGELSLKATLQ